MTHNRAALEWSRLANELVTAIGTGNENHALLLTETEKARKTALQPKSIYRQHLEEHDC